MNNESAQPEQLAGNSEIDNLVTDDTTPNDAPTGEETIEAFQLADNQRFLLRTYVIKTRKDGKPYCAPIDSRMERFKNYGPDALKRILADDHEDRPWLIADDEALEIAKKAGKLLRPYIATLQQLADRKAEALGKSRDWEPLKRAIWPLENELGVEIFKFLDGEENLADYGSYLASRNNEIKTVKDLVRHPEWLERSKFVDQSRNNAAEVAVLIESALPDHLGAMDIGAKVQSGYFDQARFATNWHLTGTNADTPLRDEDGGMKAQLLAQMQA